MQTDVEVADNDGLPGPSTDLLTDRAGRVCAASEEAARLLSAGGPLVGEPLARFVLPEDADRLHQHLYEALSSPAARCDVSLPRPGSTPRRVRLRSTAHTEGGERRVATSLCDVTDLQEALAERAAILDAALDAIVVVDDRGRVSSLNAAAVHMFGYPGAELTGRNAGLLIPSLAGDDEAEFPARYLEDAAGTSREGIGRRRDGTTFPIEIGVGALREGIQLFTLTLRDISGRKRLEEEFLQAQKMEAIGRLAGGVAHDFNNLLMGISGCANIALEKLQVPAVARSYLEEIISATSSGASITNQLLAFGRRRQQAPELLRVDAVLTEAEDMLRRLLGESILLHLSLGAGGARVRCDRGQLEQVLMNLIVNARDAMPEGGRLDIETTEVLLSGDSAHVRAGAGKSKRYLQLTVRDTGRGIDEETQKYLFEPFFTTKGVGEGPGLGLSTVYGIVEQQGGFIELTSELGSGTTFWVYLPCVQNEERAARGGTPDPEEAARPRKKVILVVEDQPLVRISIRHYLEKAGYAVAEARDGDEGLEVCRNRADRVDLLITDIVLPGMTGPRLAREIHAFQPGTPVLYMSAYARDRLIAEGKLDPGMPSLEKPFTEEALLASVREVLPPEAPAP